MRRRSNRRAHARHQCWRELLVLPRDRQIPHLPRRRPRDEVDEPARHAGLPSDCGRMAAPKPLHHDIIEEIVATRIRHALASDDSGDGRSGPTGAPAEVAAPTPHRRN
jgi:hypothetical protein